VDPNYLQSVLTKDVTPLESIYDLIDNAIDAARDLMFQGAQLRFDKYGLPASYAGSRIAIRFSKGAVSFLDNCSGIDEPTLTNQAFITGRLSQHRYGIGRFGIGLNRALFRLGSVYTLSSDTGDFAARMRFGEADLGSSGDAALVAERFPTTRRHKTFIRITGLREGVEHEFASGSWLETVIKSLARRYGIYIAKGFGISVNGKPVPAFGPGIRKDGPVADQADSIVTSEGVRVFIDAGMHESYRLTQEPGWDINKVTPLTDQYGWYFVCNDRIIKIANHESELGWTTRWHNEYYGFLGWVHFVADEVESLPWDTKKSSIDPNSSVFRQVAGKLQPFAEKYRTENRKARDAQGTGASGSGADKASGKGQSARGTPPADTVKGRRSRRSDHNENWDTLLPPMNVGLENPKIRALVYEGERLPVANCYAASMLLRSIVEISLSEHIKGFGKYQAVREKYFELQEVDGRPFTAQQKKAFRPTFTHMLDWLNKEDSYFPDEVRRECVTARNKFGKHLRELNGVVHESDLTDSSKLKIVRNDTLPLLRFLLGAVPKRDG